MPWAEDDAAVRTTSSRVRSILLSTSHRFCSLDLCLGVSQADASTKGQLANQNDNRPHQLVRSS